MLATTEVAVGRTRVTCNPDHANRPHWARGMCSACYGIWYYHAVELPKQREKQREINGVDLSPLVPARCCDQHDLRASVRCECWRRHFPGACRQYSRELPERCQWKGCLGPVVEIEGGVMCTLCSREYFAAENLARMILKGRDRDC